MYILQKKDKPRTAVQSIGPQTKYIMNIYITYFFFLIYTFIYFIVIYYIYTKVYIAEKR